MLTNEAMKTKKGDSFVVKINYTLLASSVISIMPVHCNLVGNHPLILADKHIKLKY